MYCATVFVKTVPFYELNQARCNTLLPSSDKITNKPHFSVPSRALQPPRTRVTVPLSDLLLADHLHEGAAAAAVTVQVNDRVIGAAAVKPPAPTLPVAEAQQYR